MKIKVCCSSNYEVYKDDGEQYGWRHDGYTGHRFSLHDGDKETYRYGDIEDTFEIDCDPNKTLYLVYAIYSTGSTFGRTDGCVSVQGLCESYEEASELKEKLENCAKDDYSKPWTGYFETLDYIEVEPLLIRP